MIRKAIAILLLIAACFWSFNALMPSTISDLDTDKNEFSTTRALVHLEAISQEPHGSGTSANEAVRNYIVEQLEALGLKPEKQEGFSLTKWGNLSKPKNILARIKGSEPGKALLLLSHYDSAPHSSFGASDAGSGVVTILEGLRAFLNDGKIPKNDIIVLITDAEEVGLNGADLFVNQHPWAKDVGLVLNFEARGSGGPSYMLIETNGGNANLIKGFVKANPQFPVSNSLAYSIYKMLPNDTDLTPIREDGDIDGFNFAFIDDHFDYHTALDNFERLDRETLEHQGSYIMPLLSYFSEANLSNLKSENDYIYFNVPLFKTVTYPYSWIWSMLIIAFVLFAMLITFGFKKRRLNLNDIFRGFIPYLGSILASTIITVGLWALFSKVFYPDYSEILHGFTYNGHSYISAFVFLGLAICFYIYSRFYKPGSTANLMIAPIVIWLILCLIIAIELKGASFFIIPVYFALLSLFALINQRKPSLILMALICFPLVMIMSPFVKMFPVGLGLEMLPVSVMLLALMFGFLISIFGFFKHKRRWSYLLAFVAFCLFVKAHLNSDFNDEQPKPNSLVYLLDTDRTEAKWATYDTHLDDWTKSKLGEDPNDASEIANTVIGSKYRSGFTFTREAPIKTLLYPEVEIFKDSTFDDLRHVSVYLESKRVVNRLEIFASPRMRFKSFKINGVEVTKADAEGYAFQGRTNNRLFTYTVSDNEPLVMKFSIPKGQRTEFILYESSNDLLSSRQFDIPDRESWMIPKPFVLNDAVIIKKTIRIE
ncbi:MAG: M28 family peptidase [Flavobacteriaceae bacterium]|nr:M28 family peptidase [Flavobacteriaceae bacterium]